MAAGNQPGMDNFETVYAFIGPTDEPILTPLSQLATGALPTRDPGGAGALWSDSLTVKVSAGS